ncbi:MAG: hypothetical protein O2820_02470, partial [Planctomycetota bacterium]|nr:hypothetical protein [Planctomycetota bacterium]
MAMPLKNSAVRLFRDDAGVLSSIDYILFVTILTIGSVVGLATGVTAIPPADLEGFENQWTLTWL